MNKDVLYILICGISISIAAALAWRQKKNDLINKETGVWFKIFTFLNILMFVFSIKRIENLWGEVIVLAVATILIIGSTFISAVIESKKTKTNTAYWRAGILSGLFLVLIALIYKDLL